MRTGNFSSHSARNALLAGILTNLTTARIAGMMSSYLCGMRDHAAHVGAYSGVIYETWAHRKGLPPVTIKGFRMQLEAAAALHDVGKIGIPGDILNKTGQLREDEYEIMKQHPLIGAMLLSVITGNPHSLAVEIALHHHEHWDGSGYPGDIELRTGHYQPAHETPTAAQRGQHGQDIPLAARIVATADVYDALSSSRPYKKAWTEQNILREIEHGVGTHFDPDIADAFFDSLDTIRHLKAA